MVVFKTTLHLRHLQVTKLIEDSCSTKITKTAIQQEKIIDWLVDNEVLSIALEGTFAGLSC